MEVELKDPLYKARFVIEVEGKTAKDVGEFAKFMQQTAEPCAKLNNVKIDSLKVNLFMSFDAESQQ